MLEQAIKDQLVQYFQNIKKPVELIATLDASAHATDLWDFLQELSALSPNLSVSRDGSYKRAPSFQVKAKGDETNVHFAAIPLGHELTSLILAVLWAGGHPPKVADSALERIATLPKTNLETFMSLSCHNCPDVVQATVLMATKNANIHTTIVDGAFFAQEMEARGILAVPAVAKEGEFWLSGRQELEQILDQLAPSNSAVSVGQDEAPFDVLIIGAGPAGAAAAIYAARKGIRVGVVAERFGGQTQDTLGIENYAAIKYTEGPKFSAELLDQVKSNGVKIMTGAKVQKLLAPEKEGGLHQVQLQNGNTLWGRTVIVATGARWRQLGVPGEEEYKNKGVAYCPHCDGPLFKGKAVSVIGGGNSGIEAAIDLAGICASVSVFEFADQLKADAVLVKKAKSLPNVSIYTGVQTQKITGATTVQALHYKERATGVEKHIDVSGVFVQIGLVPNNDMVKDLLECNRFGEVIIDERCATSVPGVFAAGDSTSVPYKQIGIAAGEGAKAALSAFDYLMRHTA